MMLPRYRAPPDAGPRVEAISGAHHGGGAFGELHQPAHSGEGNGGRIPLRFLVSHRGQQSPVEAELRGRFLEPPDVGRQPAAEVFHEVA
jgi:hypothetical protein